MSGGHLPLQVSLLPDLAVVESPDGAGICHYPALPLPLLSAVDMAKHEGVTLGLEQRANGELMVEAGHGYAVLGLAAVHRAVRHADRAHAP
ncbi:hypothetical protein D3C80_1772630 [compost metagenome]